MNAAVKHKVPAYCAAVIGHQAVNGKVCAMYGYGNTPDSAKRDLAEWLRIHNVVPEASSEMMVTSDKHLEPSFTHKKFYIL